MSIWCVSIENNSIGCFQIGMSLYEAQMKISHNSDISKTDIISHEKKPFSIPYVFFLRHEGIRLEFDSVSQVLVKIVATDMSAVKFVYKSLFFTL